MDNETVFECERSLDIAQEGSKGLSEEQVAHLEEKLGGEHAHDLDSRFRLLGYYTACRFRSRAIVDARARHIVWLIDNYPMHPFLGQPFAEMVTCIDGLEVYNETKLHWLNHIESNDVTIAVLINAAHFFIQNDKELAEQCLLHAQALDPTNEDVQEELRFLYKLRQVKPDPAKGA